MFGSAWRLVGRGKAEEKEREGERHGLLLVVSEELEERVSGAVGVGEVRDEDVETVAAHFRAHDICRAPAGALQISLGDSEHTPLCSSLGVL